MALKLKQKEPLTIYVLGMKEIVNDQTPEGRIKNILALNPHLKDYFTDDSVSEEQSNVDKVATKPTVAKRKRVSKAKS